MNGIIYSIRYKSDKEWKWGRYLYDEDPLSEVQTLARQMADSMDTTVEVYAQNGIADFKNLISTHVKDRSAETAVNDLNDGRGFRILHGDSLCVLEKLPDDCVDMCVTSPPYWGLRDYHSGENEIGKEDTPQEYIKKMQDIFHEVKRVLKPTGTLWVNLGDSYKDKNLLGIPWRVAFALQDDGWILRSDIIWEKVNAMPQSVSDRCSCSHEYLFMFSKEPSGYFFDYEAIEEPANYDGRKATMLQGSTKYSEATILPEDKTHDMASRPHERCKWKSMPKFGVYKYPDAESGAKSTYSGNEWSPKYKNLMEDEKGQSNHSFHKRRAEGLPDEVYAVRRKRDVWSIPTKGYDGAHFATFPEKLVEPCILAGCPKHGIVLDCFSGAATTGVVAVKNHRRYLGIELNQDYIKLSKERITKETAQKTFDF